MFERNLLLYGDNLDFLRDSGQFPNESVDLIYLDPPFNSNADYNVLFRDAGGVQSAAQIKAFTDTWSWDESANLSFTCLMEDQHTPANLAALLRTFHAFLGHSPMLAYLVQMAVRLVHLRRVLKPTGSLYLHCDPTASHYLKLVLDGIFGPQYFQNEIIWRRTGSHNSADRFGPIHDVLLFYKASQAATFNVQCRPYMRGHVQRRFKADDEGRLRFTSGGNILTGPGVTQGESGQPWRGFDPSKKGRHWALPKRFEKRMPPEYARKGLLDKLEMLYRAGLIEIVKESVWPVPVWYLDETDGQPLQDIWACQPYTEGTVYGTEERIDADVAWLGTTDPERLGYQTQKPLGLLRRCILASSNPGDVILDPFCGCGTTIDAVEMLNREYADERPRRWIGIDVTHLAINLIKYRLSRFDPPAKYDVHGEPRDLAGARQLFKDDPYQFQFWACGLVGARPVGATPDAPKKGKKGSDRGIDGERIFVDREPQAILVQVKGGKVGAAQVRDFVGTIQREKAALGFFVTLEKPTKAMRTEAAAAGAFISVMEKDAAVPKVQLVTIEQLLAGGTPRQPNGLQLPPYSQFDRTVKKAKVHDQGSLFMPGAD
jgi:site-specific DNA-methyltransferase (adenine-specific)